MRNQWVLLESVGIFAPLSPWVSAGGKWDSIGVFEIGEGVLHRETLDGPDRLEDILVPGGINLAFGVSYVEAFSIDRKAPSDGWVALYRA